MEDRMQDHRNNNSWCKILIQNNFAEPLDTKMKIQFWAWHQDGSLENRLHFPMCSGKQWCTEWTCFGFF